MGKVVVGSGWWCDGKDHDWAIGSPLMRSVAFFDIWYQQVVRCLNPDRIVITDSASPIKPDYRSYPVEWIELDRNYGHPNDIRTGRIHTKYCGFTRTVISGAVYALCCDADSYVYVNQGCLLRGDDFLRHALGDTTLDILLGAPTENGKGLDGGIAAPMLQQSLLIVRRSGLERFLQGLLGAPWTDGEVSPEEIMRQQLAPFELVQVPMADLGRLISIAAIFTHSTSMKTNSGDFSPVLGSPFHSLSSRRAFFSATTSWGSLSSCSSVCSSFRFPEQTPP